MQVRRYRPADREAVHRIAGDTAFFGQPIETYLDDRQHFLDLFVAYYTDYAPGYVWVAEAEGQVVGYLTGCPDTLRQRRTLWRRLLPRVLLRLLCGRYRMARKTWRYIGRLVLAARRGEFPSADPTVYPAHLHINVSAGWRGRGLGERLMTAYLAQLRTEGVAGVHLETTTLNTAAVRLYRSQGFELLEARRTRLWEGLIAEPVKNLLFGRRLTSETRRHGDKEPGRPHPLLVTPSPPPLVSNRPGVRRR